MSRGFLPSSKSTAFNNISAIFLTLLLSIMGTIPYFNTVIRKPQNVLREFIFAWKSRERRKNWVCQADDKNVRPSLLKQQGCQILKLHTVCTQISIKN